MRGKYIRIVTADSKENMEGFHRGFQIMKKYSVRISNKE
jgi:hypothetical protein